MILLMLMSLAAFGADAEPALDLADPWQRLAFARELADDEAAADEAAVALTRLGEVSAVAPQARAELYHLAVKERAHPGWKDIYDTLLGGELSPDGALVLSTRVAEAMATDPSTRGLGVARLQGLAAANPRRADVRLALGRALMLSGRADEARAIYQGTDGGALSDRGALVALVALGRVDEARDLAADVSLKRRDPLAAAIESGSLVARTRAVAREGYLDLARQIAGAGDPGLKETGAWLALVDELLAVGEAARAAQILERLVAVHPDAGELRKRWTSALLELGELDAAERAAGEHEASLQLVYAVRLVAEGRGDVAGRADEIGRAWRLAPRQPEVLRQHTALLLGSGEADEAREDLLPALEARPGDPALQALYAEVALAADAPDEALNAHRLGLDDVAPQDFWGRVDALAGVHTLVAEHHKGMGRPDEALKHYQIALAMRPETADYFAGIGGVLWGAGRLDEARVAYGEAHRMNPDNLGALQGVVSITLAAGDPKGALRLLNASELKAPQLQELREQARIAVLLEDITVALDAGLATDARRAFQDLLVRYPDNPRILHALGDTLLRGGQAEEALEAYQRARDFDPGNPWLAMAEANCQIELGRPKWAHDILDQFGRVEDKDALLAMNRVRARALRAEGDRLWHDLGRDQEAFERYASALEMDADPWTLAALGGLYLEHRQPAVALAFYEEAGRLDPGNGAAGLGRVNALQSLGELEAARETLENLERRATDAEAWSVQESMEVQAAIGEVDRLRLKGNTRRAQQVLDDIARRYPESPHVDAAMGSLYLDQEQPRLAFQRAERALSLDPTHGRAMVVAMDAGLSLQQMDEVVKLFEAALDGGGGERARAALDNAVFAASVERARDLSSEGRWKDARDTLDDLRKTMGDNPDHWALLGGGYLALNLTEDAAEVYGRSLEFAPSHVPSLIGLASVHENRGNLRQAERLLEEHFAASEDAQLGIELARIRGRLGRWKSGLDVLGLVREQEPEPPAPMVWSTVKPLPVLPLPSGAVPEDRPPAMTPGVASGVPLKRVDDLTEDLSSAHYPYGDLGGGFLGRTGEEGENWLTSGIVGGTVSEVYVGPVRLQADVISVLVDNGVDEQDGLAASVGIATASDRRLRMDARVGTSPIGFDAGSYATWLASMRMAVDPRIAVAADTGRVPVTDSLLSWAGLEDEATGVTYGLASYTWGGGWLNLTSPSKSDGGVRFRTGWLGGLAMDPVARREFTGWAGQQMGSDAFNIRIGGNFTWLTHDRQVDSFVPGEIGVFTPLRYTAGMIRGDVVWSPDFSGTSLCGGGAIGMQSLDGEKSIYFSPGTHRAFAAGAGMRFPITDDWRVGIDAKTESTGSDWSQQSILFRVGYLPPWAGVRGMKAPSEIHGTGVATMNVCTE